MRSSYKKEQASSKKGVNELSTTLKKNANVSSSVNKPEKRPSQQDLTGSKGNMGVNKVEIHHENASKKSDALISALKKGDNNQSGVQSSYNSVNKEEKKKGTKSKQIVI